MRIKENIVLEFDKFSSDYTRDMVNCVPHYLQLLTGIVSSLPDKFVAKNILDMGTGNGNLIERLLSRFPNAIYTLVDASPEMLRLCSERFPEAQLRKFEGYFDQFSFDKEPYDLVTASLSLHHIDSNEKRNIFKKIYDALRPGGIFTESDLMIHKSNPDHPQLIHEWGDFVKGNHEDDEKWEWIMEHYDAFDKPDNVQDQITWLKEAGFSNVHIPWNQGYWSVLQAIK